MILRVRDHRRQAQSLTKSTETRMDAKMATRRNRLVAALCVLILAASCGGDSTSPQTGFTGKWTGQVLQPKTEGNTQFDYSMNLTESGTTISGTAHISVLNQPQYFADFTVTGSFVGSQLTFAEGKITSQVPPNTGGSWCLKQGTLTLGGAGTTLTGSWTSPNGCAPGTMALTRN
jgi:hypothetical protein